MHTQRRPDKIRRHKLSQTYYVYPVVAEKAEDVGIGMYFPDFPGTAILAPDIVAGITQAKEILVARLLELEEAGTDPPRPSEPNQIELLDASDRIVYIEIYMLPYRDEAVGKSSNE